MADDALPTGWQEVENSDHNAGRYNPQPISRFEHTDTGVGIRLTPADPNVRGGGSGAGDNGDGGDYQVGVSADGSGAPSDMTPVASASDHADALGTARDFMDTYNERCVEGDEDLDSLLSDHSSQAA